MSEQKKKVVAVLNDLMFTVKIQEAAKRAGLEAIFVKSRQEAIAQAQQHPAVMIIDLNDASAKPLDVIAQIKGDEQTNAIKLLGFVSHVQTDLKHAAEKNGCDAVFARSAFSHNLPAILRRYTE